MYSYVPWLNTYLTRFLTSTRTRYVDNVITMVATHALESWPGCALASTLVADTAGRVAAATVLPLSVSLDTLTGQKALSPTYLYYYTECQTIPIDININDIQKVNNLIFIMYFIMVTLTVTFMVMCSLPLNN